MTRKNAPPTFKLVPFAEVNTPDPRSALAAMDALSRFTAVFDRINPYVAGYGQARAVEFARQWQNYNGETVPEFLARKAAEDEGRGPDRLTALKSRLANLDTQRAKLALEIAALEGTPPAPAAKETCPFKSGDKARIDRLSDGQAGQVLAGDKSPIGRIGFVSFIHPDMGKRHGWLIGLAVGGQARLIWVHSKDLTRITD